MKSSDVGYTELWGDIVSALSYIRSMHLNDKQIGILTLLVLFLLGSLVALDMVEKNRAARTRVTVIFDELGSLQPEDPVTSRGYVVGKVGTVAWIDTKARVDLLLSEPMIFREGTVIRNENFSLMGQRRVEIVPSTQGKIIDSDYLFTGTFEPGIAEAMRFMVKVREQVLAVRNVVFLLSQGDADHPSIPQATEAVLQQSEKTIDELDRLLQKASPQINGTLAQVNSLTQQAEQVTLQTDSTLKVIETQGHADIEQTNQLLAEVQKSLITLIAFLDHFESQPFAQQLLDRKDLITQVNQLITSLNNVLAIFNPKGGLKITDENGKPRPLMTFHNVNLIHKTAREKARIRQKEQLEATGSVDH